MRVAGRGRIVVWEGASLWVLASPGDETATDFHSHHAIQITISLAGGFLVRTPERSSSGPITAVAADERHVFAGAGTVAFLFVEPESATGRAIAARLFANGRLVEIDAAPLAWILAVLGQNFAADGPATGFIDAGRRILAAIAPNPTTALPDPRVESMIDFVHTNLDAPLSLGAAASAVCLSPSRARHVFAASTGLPFKAFVLWQRLERAVELFAAGRSLTEAAHEAGFADSAHLSRTFRKTFGIPASMLEVNRRSLSP